MGTKNPIEKISIRGFKSIRRLESFALNNVNVLIGANGSGKSNFVSFFHMLSHMVNQNLQTWTRNQGSADRVVSFGVKETSKLGAFIEFGLNGYKFELEPTVDGGFVFTNEATFFNGPYYGPKWIRFGSGHQEAKLQEKTTGRQNVADYCFDSIASWKVFHFHDTSNTAGVKRLGALHDNEFLRQDASNLAAYLFALAANHSDAYQKIRKTIRLAIPFFDDFILKPEELPTGEKQIRLLWRQLGSDYSLWPSQLSDGSIRFICLVTALLQPNPPSTIIIDEPELGLHPYAITLLASLVRAESKRMQIIISTQSVPLVDEFSINDLIVVDREEGASVFHRYEEDDYSQWLENYTVGELWEKNILGGRPRE